MVKDGEWCRITDQNITNAPQKEYVHHPFNNVEQSFNSLLQLTNFDEYVVVWPVVKVVHIISAIIRSNVY